MASTNDPGQRRTPFTAPASNPAIMKEVFLLLSIVLSAFACDFKAQDDALALKALKKFFGDSLTVQKNGALTIEYCPDNTCEIFRSPNSNAADPASDFAYLYLYFVSEYHYLTDWKKNPEAKTIAINILERNRRCPKAQENIRANCVLRLLSEKYSIKAAFVRYDESVRNEEAINLEAEISKK